MGYGQIHCLGNTAQDVERSIARYAARNKMGIFCAAFIL